MTSAPFSIPLSLKAKPEDRGTGERDRAAVIGTIAEEQARRSSLFHIPQVIDNRNEVRPCNLKVVVGISQEGLRTST